MTMQPTDVIAVGPEAAVSPILEPAGEPIVVAPEATTEPELDLDRSSTRSRPCARAISRCGCPAT
jgi:hypothetical protein